MPYDVIISMIHHFMSYFLGASLLGHTPVLQFYDFDIMMSTAMTLRYSFTGIHPNFEVIIERVHDIYSTRSS